MLVVILVVVVVVVVIDHSAWLWLWLCLNLKGCGIGALARVFAPPSHQTLRIEEELGENAVFGGKLKV